jgi:ABC-type bacteriocin/lantibiotic exporter with double-glycine peptidase domain
MVDTKLIKQQKPYDCAVACIAMATGKPYDDIQKRHFHQKVDLRKDGLFDSEIIATLRHEGMDVSVGKYNGSPCIMTVPSLNFAKSWHVVYWDGDQILDPQNGRKGKKYYDNFNQLSKKILDSVLRINGKINK